HIGCIGGHGRTGLVLAALAAYTKTAPKNAIQWVRKHHCDSAVESTSQVNFLVKHYKVAKAKVSKGYYGGYHNYYGGQGGYQGVGGGQTGSRYRKPKNIATAKPLMIEAVKCKGSIW
ncbi:MAG: hypothetical protein KAJ19_09215, partial [Gammaproteobacteria bacterium]|nr:hypothetical protein [Gammaproteobacteria bacterium]